MRKTVFTSDSRKSPGVLRRADILLFFLFLIAAGLIAALPLLRPRERAKTVRITSNGQEYGIYPLDQDARIEISANGHTNLVQIHDGSVTMAHSDCKNQVCVNTGAVSRTGETIVCLPNRVTVEILGKGKGGDQDEEIDAVVK